MVVLDGSRRLRSLPGVVQLLREGPSVGIYAVCLDSDERFLPGECQAVVVAEYEQPPQAVEHLPEDPAARTAQPAAGFPSLSAWYAATPADAAAPARDQRPSGLLRLRVEQTGTARLGKVRPDLVSPAWCTRLARCLSPIRDISGETEDSATAGRQPAARRAPAGAADRGRHRGPLAAGRAITTQAVVGESYDGPFALDLQAGRAARADRGHHRFRQVGAAADHRRLARGGQHAGGDDVRPGRLQGRLGVQGLRPTPAHRRHGDRPRRASRGAGTGVAGRRTEAARAHPGRGRAPRTSRTTPTSIKRQPRTCAPLPRLLIVIDEFASMVRELPDFVTGLVNIAQRGRSLGIHLLLATQRPSGVVSPEIRANTNLRIALRVTDASESSDVIDAPDAGHISKSTPGRAYVRLGHASLVPFQSGRVGGRRPGAASTHAAVAPWSTVVDWSGAGPARRAAARAGAEDGRGRRDHRPEGAGRRGTRGQRPAADPRAAQPVAARAARPAAARRPAPGPPGGRAAARAVGRRGPARPAGPPDRRRSTSRTFGHLLAAGAPRSGRSQLLRTIAGSLARTHSAADVHLYGIDCGNGALNALTRLPHCGAVVGRSQTERAVRLIGRLKGELSRRQELLAADGFADIGEQRAAVRRGGAAAAHRVLLDRWEGWTADARRDWTTGRSPTSCSRCCGRAPRRRPPDHHR